MKTELKLLLILLIGLLFFSCGSGDDPESSIDNDGIETIDNADENIPDLNETDNNTTEEAGDTTLWVLVVFAVVLVIFFSFFFWYFIPLGLWYEAWLSGVRIGWIKLAKMRLQKIPQVLILKTMIKAQNSGLKLEGADMMKKYLARVDIVKVTDTAIRAVNAGIEISYSELASQFLAKVDVETVIHALITGKNAGLEISLKELAADYLANVDVLLVVEALITAHNAGHEEFTMKDLREHYLSNGNVAKTVDAYVAVKEAEIEGVSFKHIAAIDLAGIDVKKAVSEAVNPKVIETQSVVGVAKDGVQLFLKLKLSLRANLVNYIGGAVEETVLARIDESLATEIGHATTHYDVLENPFLLADKVESKRLGKGTAYEVVSVDVSEIKVGKDVHAELQTERAHANAETAKANLISAEEKVQKAMAAAFMDGNLSIHDYHDMMNTEADTHMRKKLGDSTTKKHDDEHEHEH